MYSFVHNKVRNRLSTSEAEALVYIYANSKLQCEKCRQSLRTWYEKYLQEEDSDQEEDIPDNEWNDGVVGDILEGDENNDLNDPSEHDDIED